MVNVNYSEVVFGNTRLHQLQSKHGKMFLLAEVAIEIFKENPTVFCQDVKRGRYHKVQSSDPGLLVVATKLGIQTESGARTAGLSVLPAETVRSLMIDKRKKALLFPFRIALLKLNSQEAATLMASGSYAEALPVAMDAVKEGQDIFKPQPDLRLFPLFLLGAQANLGMKRCKQCEELLALASWLLYSDPKHAVPVMKAQLNRLYGQLHALMGRDNEALQAFAQDAYHCSLAYGPQDVRTSLAYYNLAKVFQGMQELDKTLVCCDQVMSIWSSTLLSLVTTRINQTSNHIQESDIGQGDHAEQAGNGELPLEGAQMVEVAEMLKDICKVRANNLGEEHASVAEAECVVSLLFISLRDALQADQALQEAHRVLAQHSATSKLTSMLHTAQAGLRQCAVAVP